MLYIILGASIILNIFLVWYIRELLIRFSYIEKNSVFFHRTMLDFQEHLETVYNLPMYYGEDTLKSLMNHAMEVKEITEDFKQMFDLSEQENIETEDLEQDNDQR